MESTEVGIFSIMLRITSPFGQLLSCPYIPSTSCKKHGRGEVITAPSLPKCLVPSTFSRCLQDGDQHLNPRLSWPLGMRSRSFHLPVLIPRRPIKTSLTWASQIKFISLSSITSIYTYVYKHIDISLERGFIIALFHIASVHSKTRASLH